MAYRQDDRQSRTDYDHQEQTEVLTYESLHFHSFHFICCCATDTGVLTSSLSRREAASSASRGLQHSREHSTFRRTILSRITRRTRRSLACWTGRPLGLRDDYSRATWSVSTTGEYCMPVTHSSSMAECVICAVVTSTLTSSRVDCTCWRYRLELRVFLSDTSSISAGRESGNTTQKTDKTRVF